MDGQVIIKAVLDTAGVTKGVKGVKDSLDGVTWDGILKGDDAAKKLSGSLKSAGTAATVGLTAPIVAAGAAAMSTASTYEQATAKMRSALGLTAEEAEHLGDVGESIYEDGFGESLDAVSDALITVRENMGELNDADLTAVTEGALTLEQTLGMDLTETVRGASALVKGFGMSGSEAMDLITAGAQNGLNLSDELGDNLAEYATLFQESGYSASEMFSVLEAGLDAGAYNLDKVNDLVKEFGIRIADGSVKSAVDELGGSLKATFDELSASGASNKDIFNALAAEISNMSSEQEKAAAISAIFGSQGEDNGIKVIEAMAGVSDSYRDVAGAAKEASDAASDTFANKMQSAMRELQGAVEPLGEPLLNIATNVAGVVKSFGEWFSGIGEGGQTAVLVIAGILAAIGPVLSVAGNLVSVLPAISSALGAAGGAAGLLSTATSALSGAFAALSGPVGVVLGVVAALAGMFVYLWETNETFRAALIDAWGQITAVLGECWAAIQPSIQGFLDGVMGIASALGDLVAQLVESILPVVVPIFTTLLQVATETFTSMLDTITGTLDGVKQVVQGAWDVVTGIIEAALGLIIGVVTGDFTAMKNGIDSILSGVKSIVSGAFDAISSIISGAMDAISGVVSSIWNGIRDTICGILDAISEATGVNLDGIKATVENVFNGVSRFVGNIWNGIKDAICNAIRGAKDVVSNVVDGIAGIFRGMKIQWPHIPLPHLSVTGSFSLIPPSVPKVSISWYAKGGVFNGPSVIGVGEAGPEAVVPFNRRGAQPLAEGIAELLDSGRGGDTGVTIVIEKFVNNDSDVDIDWLLREIARRIKVKQRGRGLA